MLTDTIDSQSEKEASQIQALRQRAHQLVETLHTLQHRCGELGRKEATWNNHQQALREQLAGVMKERDDLMAEREALATIEGELTKQRESHQEERNVRLNQINSLQSERDASQNQLQNLHAQLDTAIQERDHLITKLAVLSSIEQELTDQRNSLQTESNALRDLVGRLQAERDAIQIECKNLTNQQETSKGGREGNGTHGNKNFRNLHKHCIYGDEPLAQDYFQENTAIIKKHLKRNGRNLTGQAIECCEAYCKKNMETFDGPITCGDMCFIAIFVERLKPKVVYEIGVASGYSSAFLLELGNSLGLLSNQHTFLHSYDLLYVHSVTAEGKKNIIGEVATKFFPQLTSSWSLNPSTTSFDLEVDQSQEDNQLFFIDGGHEHPWPLIDVINIYKKVNNKDTWLLLQDNRVIERWYQDSYRYDVEVLKSVRGIEIVYSYWPGPKVSGAGGCYNMCAINLNVPRDLFADFVLNTINYWPNFGSENNYGSEELRNGMRKALGNYEERIKEAIKEFV